MIIRKQDSNGDMVFGKGANNFLVNSPDGVAQAVLTSLKLFQGEWLLDTTAGVPYSTKILGFGNVPFYDATIQEAILNTAGVLSITSYTSYLTQDRKLTVNVTINTDYGQAIMSTLL